MDARTTLATSETFLELLKQMKTRKEIACLLFDKQGLTRAEGLITDIANNSEGRPFVVLSTDQQTIDIDTIVGLNGIFKSDYSEC